MRTSTGKPADLPDPRWGTVPKRREQMATSHELRFELVPGWEKLPAGMSHLDAPGVGVDSHDRVYIFGRQQSLVFVYERDGTYVTSWGEGFWTTTHGLTVGPDDMLYLTDSGGHSVEKFTTDGRHVQSFGPKGITSDTGYVKVFPDQARRSASIQHAAGPYNMPCTVAVAPDGVVYVADGYGNACVHRFAPDGTYLGGFGGPGTGPGEFNLPHGIAIDAHGRVLVADRENERVQFFSATGEYLFEWTDLQRPTQVRVGPGGDVYVSELHWKPGMQSFKTGKIREAHASRMSVFSADGTLRARWGQAASDDATLPGNFTAPHDIAVDSHGDVYIGEVTFAEFGRIGLAGPDCHTVQKFRRIEG